MSMRYQAGVLSASYAPLKVPNAPSIGTFSAAGSGAGSIAFTAPGNTGGGAITGYQAIAIDSSSGAVFVATGSSSPIVISGLTDGNTYTAKVAAINSFGTGPFSPASNSLVPTTVGQQAYTSPGSYTWVAPSGVTSVSVVVVGGGGSGFSGHDSNGGNGGSLGYKNNITVVPGNSYTVVVGAGGAAPAISSATSNAGGQSYFIDTSTVQANGGSGGVGSNIGPTPSNGNFVGDGGGLGGYGMSGSTRSGGAGAAGYSGTGGLCGYQVNTTPPSSGSGGASGGISINDVAGAGGGGVGILGLGADGVAPTVNTATWANGLWSYSVANSEAFVASQGGKGGSGGANPTAVATGTGVGSYPFRSDGGNYGGGGGGSYNNNGPCGGKGGDGAVRILWPGTSRAFPSTNTGDL